MQHSPIAEDSISPELVRLQASVSFLFRWFMDNIHGIDPLPGWGQPSSGCPQDGTSANYRLIHPVCWFINGFVE